MHQKQSLVLLPSPDHDTPAPPYTPIATFASAPERSQVWRQAWERYSTRSSEETRQKIFSLSGGDLAAPLTSTSIRALIGPLQQKYGDDTFQRCLKTLEPAVSRLKGFVSIVDVFVSSNPDVAALVWGSLKTLLKLLVDSQSALEQITDGLDQICFEFPLFDRWGRQFPKADFAELGDALTNAYCEFIGFCIDIIDYFSKSPVVNVFRVTLSSVVKKRIENMREHTRRVKLQYDTENFESLNKGIDRLLNSSYIHSKPLVEKTVYNISEYKTPLYFSRPTLEQDLLSMMAKPSKNQSFPSLCVHGPPGCGKTQLVLEILARKRRCFDTLLWFRASSMEKLDKDFSRVGERLGIPISSSEGGSIVDIVLNWLQSLSHPWIMVLDDAHDSNLISQVWPNFTVNGIIIMTTTDPVAMQPHTSEALHVPPYDRDEGARFLSSCSGDGQNSSEQHLYPVIAERLGGLPVLLTVVANLIKSSDCSVSDLVEMLDESPAQDLDVSSTGYTRTPEHILSASFSGLDTNALRLLDVMAFLDGDSIPRQMLRSRSVDHPQDFKFLQSTKHFTFAYRALKSRSLVHQSASTQTISFHGFFQDATYKRLSLDEDKYNATFGVALDLLIDAFPKHTFAKRRDVESWKTCETYIEHVKFLEKRCAGKSWSNSVALRLAGLLYRAAWYLFERGRCQRGLETIEKAEPILDDTHPENLILLADIYWMHGRFYNQSNQPHKSEPLFAKAVEYAESAVSQGLLSGDAARLASFYSSHGNALTGLKRFAEAERRHLRSIEVREAAPSIQGEMIAMSYTNLGSCLLCQGRLEEAEEILQQKVLHRYNRSLECSKYALGNVWLAQGRLDESLSLHKEVLDRFIERTGYDHTDTANSCHKVGVIYHKRGELDQSLSFLSKALQVYEAQGRQTDIRPARARTLWCLSQVLEDLKDFSKAKDAREEAEKLRQEVNVYKDVMQQDKNKLFNELVFFWSR